MTPVKLAEAMFKLVKLVKPPNSVGIGPVILVEDRFKAKRLDNAPRVVVIGPIRGTDKNSSDIMLTRLPSSVGNDPA